MSQPAGGAPALREAGFSLDFCTFHADGLPELAKLVEASLADGGRALQQWIVVPPGRTAAAGRLPVGAIARGSCPTPLVFTGHSGFPLQYASVVARPVCGSARVETTSRAAILVADGVVILYGKSSPGDSGLSDASVSLPFEAMHGILGEHGLGVPDIARTWLFMEEIQVGYESLNRARSRFFSEHPLPEGHFFPASTGVGARVAEGGALTLAFCAFSGAGLSLRRVPSPLQGEATAYEKLFSRAVAVDLPGNTLLFVSGTAAIDGEGRSLFPADPARQMERTLEVIAAILHREGAAAGCIVQAVVYLKRASDLAVCRDVCRAAAFPCERTLFQLDTPICRDELLCEVEATVVVPRS